MSSHRIADINRERVPLLVLWAEFNLFLDQLAKPAPVPFDPWKRPAMLEPRKEPF